MAAPVFESAGTIVQGGTRSSFAADVPAGVVANDVILVGFFHDGATNQTITPPAGFTAAPNMPINASNHRLHLWWKRATGGVGEDLDLGTYTFSWATAVYCEARALRYSGCVTIGNPFETDTGTAFNNTNSTTSPAVSTTTDAAGRLIVHGATNWAGGTWTAPTGYTKRVQGNDGLFTVSDVAQAVAGSTGSVTATSTGSDKMTAFIGSLIPTAGGGGGQTVTASGIPTAEAFGAATVTPGASTISPAGIAAGEAFGTPTVSTGALTISPVAIGPGEAFGAATIQPGAVTLSPTGIPTGEAFGTALVSSGGATIAPSSIASGEVFGTPTLTTGAVTIAPSGIASGEAFGAADVTSLVTLAPIGIGSAEAFGVLVITVGGVVVSPTGIASAEAFGTAQFSGGQVIPIPDVLTLTAVTDARTLTAVPDVLTLTALED